MPDTFMKANCRGAVFWGRVWPVVTAGIGFLAAVLMPGLNRLGDRLADWAIPPTTKPTVAALPSDDGRQIVLALGNDGERLTTVVAVHFCTAKHAWFAYDPVKLREEREMDAARREQEAAQGGPHPKMGVERTWSFKMALWEPITPEEYADLRERVERDQWVVECKPMEKQTLRKSGGDRTIKPRDANEATYESPGDVKLAVSESGFGLVGGNTWCALTVRFSSGESVSRVYLCETGEGYGWKASPEDNLRSTAPELKAIATPIPGPTSTPTADP